MLQLQSHLQESNYMHILQDRKKIKTLRVITLCQRKGMIPSLKDERVKQPDHRVKIRQIQPI